MAFCRKGSDRRLGSPPEAGTDQTSLPSQYSTLVPLEIKRPIPTLSVVSLVSCTTLSTCGTSIGQKPDMLGSAAFSSLVAQRLPTLCGAACGIGADHGQPRKSGAGLPNATWAWRSYRYVDITPARNGTAPMMMRARLQPDATQSDDGQDRTDLRQHLLLHRRRRAPVEVGIAVIDSGDGMCAW